MVISTDPGSVAAVPIRHFHERNPVELPEHVQTNDVGVKALGGLES